MGQASSLASLQLVANCLGEQTAQPGGRSGGLPGLRTGRCARGDFLWVRPELGEFGISAEARKGNGEVLVLLLGASCRGTCIRDIHDT